MFISILTVEGKTEISDPPIFNTDDGNALIVDADKNVYKRVAEYCLDLGEIC